MNAKAAILAGLIALTAAPLAGCGFTPLYAEGQTAAQLGVIEVSVNDARTGYLLRERLDDELARDASRPATYRLSVTVSESRDPRGLNSAYNASRYELRATAAYVLTDIATGRQLITGSQEVLIAYQAAAQPYAGVVAQEDSQKRAAAELARRIRLEVAKYFAASEPRPPPS